MPESVQLATLKRAIDLAGSVNALAKRIGVTGHQLFTMLDGGEIPAWVFIRAADFINEVEANLEQYPFDADRHEGNDTRQ